MDGIIRLCGVAILCTVCIMLLGRIKGELAPLVRIGGIVTVFGFVIVGMGGLLGELQGIAEDNGVTEYASILMKAVGLALLCKICSDICKDCGEGTLASGVELSGKLSILSLCIPLIRELMGYVFKILELE